MAGQMVHVEIPAGDTAKAREFWGGLFGWKFEEYPGSPTEYHMTRFSDTQGGAIMGAESDKRGARVYFDVDDVNAASDGVSFASPEGEVTINGENHHIAKTALIGQINSDNQFDIAWSSGTPIEPDPFLEGYSWWNPDAE